MPSAPEFVQMRHVDQQSGIDIDADGHPVLRDGGHIAQRRILRLLARVKSHLLRIGLFDAPRRPHMHVACLAIDDDRIAGVHDLDQPSTWPTAGMPSARATIATWLVCAGLLENDARAAFARS